jgi:ABC-2 type transport system permease protein
MVYLETFKREFLSIFKYKGLLIILFVGPIFLTLFFGGVYYNDYVKDIPIAILDEDGSSLSQLVDNYFLSNERFDITNYPSSRQELERLIDNGKVQMGLIIPPGFESEVTTYQSSQILAMLDGSNIVVANNALAQASLITQSISAGVEMKLIQGKGLSPQMAQDIALVYNVGERMLFDPKMTYMNYLIICFLAVFIQQLMLSAMGSTFIRDGQYLSDGKVLQKVLAATSACFVGILPAAIICMFILLKGFHVPMIGNLLTIIILTVVFIAALIGPSLLIASMTKSRVKYSQISFMLSLPTFVSSGCVWPVEQMPKALEFIIRLSWPLINYAKLVQEILIKGLNFATVIPNILHMLLFSLVWIPVGIICYKKAFKEDAKQVQLVNTAS